MIQATNFFPSQLKYAWNNPYLQNSKANQSGSNIDIENSSMTSFTDLDQKK